MTQESDQSREGKRLLRGLELHVPIREEKREEEATFVLAIKSQFQFPQI